MKMMERKKFLSRALAFVLALAMTITSTGVSYAAESVGSVTEPTSAPETQADIQDDGPGSTDILNEDLGGQSEIVSEPSSDSLEEETEAVTEAAENTEASTEAVEDTEASTEAVGDTETSTEADTEAVEDTEASTEAAEGTETNTEASTEATDGAGESTAAGETLQDPDAVTGDGTEVTGETTAAVAEDEEFDESKYQHDEEGNLILDEDGNPIPIEGEGTASSSEKSSEAVERTTTAGGVEIGLYAEAGVLPNGVKMSARKVNVTANAREALTEAVGADNVEIKDILAIDIRLKDADGETVQPEGAVTVTYEVSNTDIWDGVDSAAVYYVDGDEVEWVTDAAVGEPVTFDAPHFSVYALVLLGAAEEEEQTYTLNIEHVLTADVGGAWGVQSFGEVDTIELTAEDLADGYDLQSHTILREGLEVTSELQTLTADDFVNGTLDLRIDYGVKDGYRAIYNKDLVTTAVYMGTFSDVDIVLSETVGIAIKIYKNGVLTDRKSVALDLDNNKGAKFTYPLTVENGYTITVTSEDNGHLTDCDYENGKVSATVVDGEDSAIYTLRIDMDADTVEYTVLHKYEDEEAAFLTEKKSGTAGEMTQAEPYDGYDKDHYTIGDIAQVEIKAAGTEVTITYIPKTFYVIYETEGGSYVAPTFGKYNTTVSLNAQKPTRQGYTFKGWSLTPDGGDVVRNVTIKGETHVYAKWEPANVEYTLVYMAENADDDAYSYVGSVKLKGLVGTTVTADSRDGKPSGFDNTHFTFSRAESKEIAGDGSTVILVYYLRNRYTITFKNGKIVCGEEEHKHTDDYYTGSGRNKELKCTKKEHTHNNNCYKDATLTAKYDADIRQLWESTVGSERAWYWEGKNWTYYQAKMPGKDKTVKEKEENGTKQQTLTYYVEVDPNEKGAIAGPSGTNANGKYFKIYLTYTMKTSGSPTFNEEYFEIDGYERCYSNIFNRNGSGSGWSNDGINKFYYTRKNYTLELMNWDGNGSSSSKSQSVPYTASLNGYLTHGNNSGATFEGWYIDPELTTENTNTTMPNDGCP